MKRSAAFDVKRAPIRLLKRIHGLLVTVLLAPLRLYRRLISPNLAPRCKYYPTCSAYAEQAVSELGIIRGTLLAGWRLLRCNPLSRGGIDPLSERRFFRSANGRRSSGSDSPSHVHAEPI